MGSESTWNGEKWIRGKTQKGREWKKQFETKRVKRVRMNEGLKQTLNEGTPRQLLGRQRVYGVRMRTKKRRRRQKWQDKVEPDKSSEERVGSYEKSDWRWSARHSLCGVDVSTNTILILWPSCNCNHTNHTKEGHHQYIYQISMDHGHAISRDMMENESTVHIGINRWVDYLSQRGPDSVGLFCRGRYWRFRSGASSRRQSTGQRGRLQIQWARQWNCGHRHLSHIGIGNERWFVNVHTLDIVSGWEL